jgi:prepilin-type processing-associated H-X9-DG protein
MKPNHARQRTGGFTGWDLLICVVVVGVLAALLLPALSKGGSSRRINCVSNLRQLGLAFRLWSNDHGGKFPMALSSGGINRGTMDVNLTGEVWRHFQAISNEIISPKVLACYSDQQRSRTGNWQDFTNNSHLSYFIGLDADQTTPQTILSGDRNLTSPTIKPVKGVLNITTIDRVEWTRSMHNRSGNVALADGSASQATSMQLSKQFQAALVSATRAIHRIALPE